MPEKTYWNAEVYERIGTPMRGWAQEVIDGLELRGDEVVLDAGCGSGSVTFDLLERLPRGRVYAVDSSPDMIEKLKRSLEERGEKRVSAMRGDLTDFMLPEQVDAVFSNAVFHWIPDDAALFGCLLRATKSGGRLRAQCGGGHNIARLREATHDVEGRAPYSDHLTSGVDFRKYRSAEEAKAAMEQAGWVDVRTSLFEAPVVFENEDDAVLYLRTIILQLQANALPAELSDLFLRDVVHETVRRFGEPFVADYVRLDLWANAG
jgi:trans-aconitate 2-methyltransferase